MTREEAEVTVPLQGGRVPLALGKVSPTPGCPLSQMGLAVPTEQDVGIHWRGDRSYFGIGV